MKSSPYFWLQYTQSRVRWRFRKILWPSQNIWTLSSGKQMTTALPWVKPLHFQNFYKKKYSLQLHDTFCTICTALHRFALLTAIDSIQNCNFRYSNKTKAIFAFKTQCWLLAMFRILVCKPRVWVEWFPEGIPSRSIWFIEILKCWNV